MNWSSSLSLWKLFKNATSFSLFLDNMWRIGPGLFGLATNTLNTWKASKEMLRLLSRSSNIINFRFDTSLMYLVMMLKLALSSKSSPRSWNCKHQMTVRSHLQWLSFCYIVGWIQQAGVWFEEFIVVLFKKFRYKGFVFRQKFLLICKGNNEKFTFTLLKASDATSKLAISTYLKNFQKFGEANTILTRGSCLAQSRSIAPQDMAISAFSYLATFSSHLISNLPPFHQCV